MRLLATILFVCVLLTACSNSDEPAALTDTLRVATGPAGGTWDSLGEFLTTAFADAGYAVKLVPGGGVSNVQAVNDGEVDVALSLGFLAHGAELGTEPFHNAMPDVTSLGNLYPQYLYALVQEGYAARYNINTFRDLMNDVPLRLAVLKSGTASELLARRAIEMCGDNLAGITMRGGVARVDYATGFKRLVNGEVDVFVFSMAAPAKAVSQARDRASLRILPMDDDLLEGMRQECGTTVHTIRKDTYLHFDTDTPVVGDYTCLLVNRNMSEKTAHALAQALWQHWDELSEIVPAITREDRPQIFSSHGFPLHPGARRLAQEHQGE